MLHRSRVGTSLDTARLGAALARPGLDTRVWSSLAYVVEFAVDPEAGPIASVILAPSGLEETARVGSEYAGNGWGIYAPLYADDEVLVEAPTGDPDEGLIITRRLWSPADKPPSDAVAHPEDLILHVQSGKNVRLAVAGGGKILLGSDSADTQVVRFSDLKNYFQQLLLQLDQHVHTTTAPGSPTTPPVPPTFSTSTPGQLPANVGSSIAQVAP